MPVPTRITDFSTTAASNYPTGAEAVGTTLDDYLRGYQAVIALDLASKGSDIASATTTDLGAVGGLSHDITGNTTITGFGTVRAGIPKIIKFEDALTLTHNATSLILPGAANITTANGDVAVMISEGSGNWRCVSYSRATQFASAAATLTGTSEILALTPGGFAGNKSLAANGYYKFPGGLIIQWFSAATNATAGTGTNHTLPVAFASAIYGGVACITQNISSGSPHTVALINPTTTTITSQADVSSLNFFAIVVGV